MNEYRVGDKVRFLYDIFRGQGILARQGDVGVVTRAGQLSLTINGPSRSSSGWDAVGSPGFEVRFEEVELVPSDTPVTKKQDEVKIPNWFE